VSYTETKTADFGSGKGGLSTVGYVIYNEDGTTLQARTTTGISEVGTSTGVYQVVKTFDDSWDGYIVWDTGDTPLLYAVEDIYHYQAQTNQEIVNIRKIWNTLKTWKGYPGTGKVDWTAVGEHVVKRIERLPRKGLTEKQVQAILRTEIAKISIPAPIVKIPKTEIPDYTSIFKSMKEEVRNLKKELSQIPKKHKTYSPEFTALNLRSNELKALLTQMGNSVSKEFDRLGVLNKTEIGTAIAETKTLYPILDKLTGHVSRNIDDKISNRLKQEDLKLLAQNITATVKIATDYNKIFEKIVTLINDIKTHVNDPKKIYAIMTQGEKLAKMLEASKQKMLNFRTLGLTNKQT